MISILFVGDIVGSAGINMVENFLPTLIKKHSPDFVIANGENSHEGHGINEQIIKHLHQLGVHVITGGNHSFAKWKVFSYMRNDGRILRPFNYPSGNAGFGYGVFDIPGTVHKIGVINLQGRTFMQAIDDPFSAFDRAYSKISEQTSLVFVDFHAEATAEKIAFAWYADGRAGAVVGTHTHVPTNDARIFPNGTGFLCDAGMTGAFHSVLGMSKDVAIKRFMTGVHQKYQEANGNNQLCGVIVKLNPENGKCVHIEPLIFPGFKNSTL